MSHSSLSIFSSEIKQFRYFFRRLVIFAVPFLLGAVFIAAIDPFDFVGIGKIVPDQVKYQTAGQLNPPFWRLNKFSAAPEVNILLGDSRMQALDVEEIKKVSGQNYANLAYGGGSLREAFDTFWLADKKIKLKRVYLGVNLNTFNDYEITNRVEFYRAAQGNPALYFVNRTVWEAAGDCLYQTVTGNYQKVGVPQMSKEEFWQEELGIMRKYYDKYAEPRKYRGELTEIADHCRKNNIELSFIIFPTHTDEQKLVTDSGLDSENMKMKNFLSALGTTFDFENESDLTRNKQFFDDPVHLTKEGKKILIDEIWMNNVRYETAVQNK